MRLLVVGLITVLSVLAGPVGARAEVTPLPDDTHADYQLSGPSPLEPGVGIVVRDREDRPAAGAYNVCYVNGFQTQPHERRFWRARRHLLLKRGGRPVVDEAWGEMLLDLRTRAKRRQLARIMGRWVRGCADDGFDAVEFDNLDSFTRSRGLLTRRHATTYARLLVRRAHAAGLAAAQKNLAGWNGRRAGYDFAVAEECGRWRECGAYVDDYGSAVMVVEYRRRDFDHTCRRWGDLLPVVLRDVQLTTGGVREFC